MSRLDIGARLRRAVQQSADSAGLALTITHSDTTRWASATFTGARHALVLAATADDATEAWLAALPEAELAIVGYLVADLKIVAMTQTDRDLSVTIEVLTVEER